MLDSFYPGEQWFDTDGRLIQAHGGGIMLYKGVYYWYGEHRGYVDPPRPGERRYCPCVGVGCYSSRDLYNWKYEGLMLTRSQDPAHDLYARNVVERPKCIYNAKTGKFVLWMHIDSPSYGYARAGYAIGDTPVGPFTYKTSIRPNGCMSRDMTVFQDDDGCAYIFHSSEDNKTMVVSRLDRDYTHTDGVYARIFPQMIREAPAVVKRKGYYYCITSFCTGWAPNEAMAARAEHPLGPWEVLGNPCVSAGKELTYGSQSTHLLPIEGQEDAILFMADIWNPGYLTDSRYLWLPLQWKDDLPEIPMLKEWRWQTPGIFR